jgi:hypothetical protein
VNLAGNENKARLEATRNAYILNFLKIILRERKTLPKIAVKDKTINTN